ncbi:MAG: hemerythrin domain-containing protein [Paludibacteraceae bacterium]|nr:hemerythrin domain-containing protein [Paludibacteraceae bacterium]MBR4839821.1 hemerythrin domain-containing protein [Paludibacteraceae bacterium]
MHTIFTEKQKLTELLEVNPQLILMLPRFDMKLGFGEKRVGEICHASGVPSELFLLLCNVYTFDSYEPTEEEIASIDGKMLVKYLIASHDYYLNHRLKHIGKHVERIAHESGNIGSILINFFHEYSNEVEEHFKEEENTLFPILLQGGSFEKGKFNLKEMAGGHGSIEDKLSDLTNIIIKYLPADIMPNERIGVWFDISQLSKDIRKHAIIEEKILIPYVEQKRGGKK